MQRIIPRLEFKFYVFDIIMMREFEIKLVIKFLPLEHCSWPWWRLVFIQLIVILENIQLQKSDHGHFKHKILNS